MMIRGMGTERVDPPFVKDQIGLESCLAPTSAAAAASAAMKAGRKMSLEIFDLK